MNRAIKQVLWSSGEPHEALQLAHQPIPNPSPGHVVVRMLISVVNPTDLSIIRNSKLAAFKDTGAVPGSEGVGVVHEVAEGITRVKPGQRVVPIIYWKYLISKGQGAWQDYVEIAEEDLVLLPDCVSDESAAQFVINPWTVYGLLTDLAIPEGEYLLQTAGGSVLGRQVIQLAKHLGLKTISVIRRETWREELQALGADKVINAMDQDVVARVMEITGGKGAYAGIDAVAGISTKTVAASVRDGGDVFVYGLLSSSDVTVSAKDLMRKVNVTFWNLSRFLQDEERKEKLLKDVLELFVQKVVDPLVGRKYGLADVNLAIVESERDGRGGKVLLMHGDMTLL